MLSVVTVSGSSQTAWKSAPAPRVRKCGIAEVDAGTEQVIRDGRYEADAVGPEN